MSEAEALTENEAEQSKYFKIRKEVVGLSLLAMTFWAAYQIHDWWRYMDWPPYDGSNKQLIKELNCNTPSDIRTPTRAELKSWSIDIASTSSFMTRDYLLKRPQCAALTYFHFEGSGTRKTVDIVDVEKKAKTAKIVITFESDERSYK